MVEYEPFPWLARSAGRQFEHAAAAERSAIEDDTVKRRRKTEGCQRAALKKMTDKPFC
jgi:hypothetical protein